MVPSLVVAIDPSYKGMGISVIRDGKLSFFELKTEQKIISFRDCVLGCKDIRTALSPVLAGHKPKDAADSALCLVEIPPTKASYAPGLFLLDGAVVQDAMSLGFKCFGLSCQTCKSVIGSRSATKDDSVQFVNDYLTSHKIEYKSYTTKHPGIIKSDNVSESFILLLVFSYKLGWGRELFPEFDKFSAKDPKDINLVEF